MAVMNKP